MRQLSLGQNRWLTPLEWSAATFGPEGQHKPAPWALEGWGREWGGAALVLLDLEKAGAGRGQWLLVRPQCLRESDWSFLGEERGPSPGPPILCGLPVVPRQVFLISESGSTCSTFHRGERSGEAQSRGGTRAEGVKSSSDVSLKPQLLSTDTATLIISVN